MQQFPHRDHLLYYIVKRILREVRIEKWVANGFSPQNLNIILDSSWYSAQIFYREFLLASWARWNSQIAVGHVACLKLYSTYKTPLNLFQNAPVFQLQFGKTATLPFVQPSSIDEWLLLSDHDDGSRKAAICIRENALLQSSMYKIINDHGVGDQNNSITNLQSLISVTINLIAQSWSWLIHSCSG